MKTLAESMQQYATKFGLDDLEGIKETAIDGVWFYRSSKGNNRQPFVYQSGIIVLGQGYKNIHIGQSPVRYGPMIIWWLASRCRSSVKRLPSTMNPC